MLTSLKLKTKVIISLPSESFIVTVCHAEMNAILNKNTLDLKNCTIYVGRFPCNECAKIIIQSGIREVIYLTCKDENDVKIRASKRMFDSANVEYK